MNDIVMDHLDEQNAETQKQDLPVVESPKLQPEEADVFVQEEDAGEPVVL